MLLDLVDLVLSDLLIGYYLNDEWVKGFVVVVEEGYSYVYYLLME